MRQSPSAMRYASRLFAFVTTGVILLLASAVPAAAQGAGLCFYEHSDFRGQHLCMSPGQRIANLDQINGDWNDRISSVQIPPGLRVSICEHANFSGRCLTLDRSVSNFQSINFNDRVSSISVEGGGGRGPDFGGRPPGFGDRGPGPRFGDEDPRRRMFELRERCEDGDRRACVRFGIVIGENRERNAQWRRESPEFYWWDR